MSRERIGDLQATILDIGTEQVNTFGKQLQEIVNKLDSANERRDFTYKEIGKVVGELHKISDEVASIKGQS